MPLMVKTLLKSLGKLQPMMLAEGSKERENTRLHPHKYSPHQTTSPMPLPMEQARETNPRRIQSPLEMPRGNEVKVSKDST